MQKRLTVIAATLPVLGLLSFGAGVGSAASKTTFKHKCAIVATNQTPTKSTGYDFATERCNAPYGAGLAVITYKETLSTTHEVIDQGKFKSFYNAGTDHGTYKLIATIPATGTTITAVGTLKIVGGTGAYAGVKAKGKMACVTNDGGDHYACVVKF